MGVENGDSYTQQPNMQAQYAPQQQPLEGKWENGLCGCCSPFDLCLKATFCPCFVFGKTQARLRDPSLQTYDMFNVDCLIWCGLGHVGCSWIYQFIKRQEVRDRYAINGNGFSDCMTSFCCQCCDLIQQEKEVTIRTEKATYNQGYVSQPGMVITPAN